MNATMNLTREQQQARARFLSRAGSCATAASAGWNGRRFAHGLRSRRESSAPQNPLSPENRTRGEGQAVIYIFQAGAPSHLELFDNNPNWLGTTASFLLLSCSRVIGGVHQSNSALLGPNSSSRDTGNAAWN